MKQSKHLPWYLACMILIAPGMSIFASEYQLSPDAKIIFACKNVIQVETYSWPHTLVTYPVKFSGGVKEPDILLINQKTGKEEVYQLSDKKTSDGTLVAANINFFAELPLAGEYKYELSTRTDNVIPAKTPRIKETPEWLEFTGNKIQVRLPKTAGLPANEVPAPIMAIGQNNNWIGNNKIFSPKKKITSIQSRTIESGALFIEQELAYQFEGGGEYIVKVKLIKDYPFAILDETMINLSKDDSITMEMKWDGFSPAKRFGTQWDRNMESADAWLGINKPVYTSYSKEDPHWTGMGWIEDPAKQMIFRISPFGGNSVREQTPVMSFWEDQGDARELGVFVYDHNKWNDKQYGIWQPTPTLSIYFRYTNNQLYFTYPLISGSRSTAVSFFPKKTGEDAVEKFNTGLSLITKRGGKNDPKEMYYRYSQLLLMQYASLSLDRIKDWQLTYPGDAKHPANPFSNSSGRTREDFIKEMSISPMAYYPLGLNFYPGVHSIEHRSLYTNYVEDYLRFYKELTPEQRQNIEALFIMGGYVNTLEEMNSIRNALAGTANMAADGWCVPAQISFLFPEHPMAKEWADYFEKCLQIYGLFYTRPNVRTYESNGGRWSESLSVYNWAYLRPTTHSNIAAELSDGKNRFASPYMVSRANWMENMLTAPISGKGRCYPPHGAHGGGCLVPRYTSFFETADWLKYYAPIVSENMFWTGGKGQKLENHAGDSDWDAVYQNSHPETSNGTNPHLKSTKFTGHGIVLRAGVDSTEELSIHMDQVDKGPNYRWGNQGEGNCGGLYFYARGKIYTGYENEITGDHTVNNLDGVTNFGVMKNGEYRTIGMNELKAPLYDFGFAQFAELLSDDGKDKYVWPDYLSRSVMLVGTDYFILFDEMGTNWRGAGRFSWFNVNGEDFPKITFLSSPARKDSWITTQTPNSNGFYRDNFGSVLALVTHKSEVLVDGGKPVTIPLLKNANISDFSFNKNDDLPKGVVRISTPKSKDMIFRNDSKISHLSDKESFSGKAGFIRRFQDGHLELAMFKGSEISADGLSIGVQTEGNAAVAIERNNNNELNGTLKAESPVRLKLSGLAFGMKLYVNGLLYNVQAIAGGLELPLQKGSYKIEYAQGDATPIESRILATEYEKDRVKLIIERTAKCKSVRIDASYDGGITWKPKGKTTNDIFYLPNEQAKKIHVRAVSVNGTKESVFAQEYPVYFTKSPPHYPDGLCLKLDKNRVDLSWGSVLGTQKYRLYRRKTDDKNYQLIYEGKDCQFTDTKIEGVQKNYELPGFLDNSNRDKTGLIIYEYALTAVNGFGESEKSHLENTDPASWINWYPNTALKFKRQSAFWMMPYVYPEMVPEKYYPE